MIELLKELCLANGVSGDEDAVRELIISKLSEIKNVSYEIDALGNLIVKKQGEKEPANKVMLSAHMDEVGLIVTYINSDGTLKFDTVGGVNSAVIFGKRVRVGKSGIVGVIGSVAVHNVDKEKHDVVPDVEEMTIDIGACDRDEAEKLVSKGDAVYFDSQFIEFGDDCVKSKAIDDRAGCSIMLEMLKGELEYTTYFCFVTQEEIGLRGSKTAAFSVNPDYAIVLESTTASDIPSASDEKQVCKLGKGAVVSFMDRSTAYNRRLYDEAFEIAKAESIPCQTKTMIAGGNDAGSIHLSCGGVKTVSISIPCRYLHSPSCVIKKSDYDAVKELAIKLSAHFYNR